MVRWSFFIFLFFSKNIFAIELQSVIPSFEVKGTDNKSFKNEHLQSKVTVINFWATWCQSCKVEIKEMVEKFKPLQEKNNFQLIFVSLDKEPESATRWFKENLSAEVLKNNPLFFDPNFELADKISIETFPMTLILSQDGKVIHIEKGFEEGKGSVAKMVDIAGSAL